MPTNIRRTNSFSLDLRHIDEKLPINLKKVDTKENTGTLKVALRPQREMVDKPSSGLDEIQLRTQRLKNILDQVYCA